MTAANQRVALAAKTTRYFLDIGTQQIDKSDALANASPADHLSSRAHKAASERS